MTQTSQTPSLSPLSGLHDDFPEMPLSKWEEAVSKALKGGQAQDLNRLLPGDIEIAPLYTPAHAAHKTDCHIAGQGIDRIFSGWPSGAVYQDPDLTRSNARIHADLQGGCNAITLSWPGKNKDQIGLPLYNLKDMEAVLKDIAPSYITTSLRAGSDFFPAAILQLALWEKTVDGGSAEERHNIKGHLNIDPLGSLAKTGNLPTSLDQAYLDMAEISAYAVQHFSKVTSVAVDGSPYYEAGANDVQTLANMLSTATSYLRALTDHGLSLESAFDQIQLIYPIGCDFFLSIAALRCLSDLWTRIGQACGLEHPATPKITALMSQRVLTKYDPWVNLLRASVICCAAGIGGASQIALRPYDAKHGLPSDFAHRLMRNIQLMAQEESGLHKVADPAGGSWAVESLTTQLAEKAWQKFQQIEADGGLFACLSSGQIAAECQNSRDALRAQIASRAIPITGVTEFPAQTEAPLEPQPDAPILPAKPTQALPLDSRDIRDLIEASILKQANIADIQQAGLNQATAGETLSTADYVLPQFYLAEEFETLRDHVTAAHLPPIQLIALGNLADHTARVNFAKNALQTVGLTTEDILLDQDPDAVKAALSADDQTVILICGTDAAYEAHLSDLLAHIPTGQQKLLSVVSKKGKCDAYAANHSLTYLYQGCQLLAYVRKLIEQHAPTVLATAS